jgi:RNA polymerase sigma-70 factor (ECF subfamily)
VGSRTKLFCVVPTDLADELHDVLCEHFHHEDVDVVVERRGDDRRGGERRSDRGTPGRRAALQRASVVASWAPPLPPAARPYGDRLIFVERLVLLPLDAEDRDTNDIIGRIHGGEERAFEDLYLRYFDRIYAYARVALGNAHEAEDLTQQVFLRTLENLHRVEVRPAHPFRHWLFRVAHNQVVNHVRKHRRVELVDPARMDREREGAADVVALSLSWLSDEDLMRLVERLPLAQRQVLVLSCGGGLTLAEIAQITDRTPDAVRQQQSRALRFLEQRMVALGRSPQRWRGEPSTVLLRQATVLRARRFRLVL